MNKEKRHLIHNKLSCLYLWKHYLRYLILKSIKFNRNIPNIHHLLMQFFNYSRKSSISKNKSICLFSGYKRAIINKFSTSRFIANKLAKHGLLINFKPSC